MQDNLLTATNSMRTVVGTLRKKLIGIRSSIDSLESSLDQLDGKFDKILTEAEIYKTKLERDLSREIRRLEKELEDAKKATPVVPTLETPESELRIASTVSIFETLLYHICNQADDFKLVSYSFLFPAVIERVLDGSEEAYFIDVVPDTMNLVIDRGIQYVQWVREVSDTYLTDKETWEALAPEITNWWRNDALPLLYGGRDEQWDIDEPLSRLEMLSWRDNPAERPFQFSPIYDTYEIYLKHKDAVYEKSNLREFDFKRFSLTK
jgi:hypothetical protein